MKLTRVVGPCTTACMTLAPDTAVGRAGRIPRLERFFTYAKAHPGVWFARRSEVARWALAIPLTPREQV
jgi:hypothetical protein